MEKAVKDKERKIIVDFCVSGESGETNPDSLISSPATRPLSFKLLLSYFPFPSEKYKMSMRWKIHCPTMIQEKAPPQNRQVWHCLEKRDLQRQVSCRSTPDFAKKAPPSLQVLGPSGSEGNYFALSPGTMHLAGPV